MHETGVIRKMIQAAQAEANRQEGALVGIEIRLGVLAGGSPQHLREHFEIELGRLGLSGIRLDIREEPEYPGGVEITAVELRR